VKAGAAGEDHDRVDAREIRLCIDAEQLGHDRLGAGHHLQRVGQRPRLLEDFLLHVVPVGAEFDRVGRQLALVHLALDFAAAGIDDAAAIEADLDHVAFLEVDDLLGYLQQGGGIGGGEILAFADAHQQRRALARRDQDAGLPLRQDGDRVGALQLGHRVAHGLEQAAAALQVLVHEVGHHLGVGVGRKAVAGLAQALADRLVVLDDAVVDHGEAVVADMRMRVALAGRAVGGPARMRDAELAFDARLVRHLLERGHASDAAQAMHAAVDDREACRVIAAILELAQAFEQDGNHVAPCDGAYDAAHENLDR
jgi:hypothetical protein